MTGRQVRRGVVFDLDGVIVDSEHLWEESWTAYAREQGREWRRGGHAAAAGAEHRGMGACHRRAVR